MAKEMSIEEMAKELGIKDENLKLGLEKEKDNVSSSIKEAYEFMYKKKKVD